MNHELSQLCALPLIRLSCTGDSLSTRLTHRESRFTIYYLDISVVKLAMDLKDRKTAIAENIAWFSKLSPSQKIRALEKFKRQVRYLKNLQTIPQEDDNKNKICAHSK